MEWISVEDRLPDDKISVLGFCISENDQLEWNGIVQVYFSRNTGWHRCELYDKKSVHITHWMMIPEKPVS